MSKYQLSLRLISETQGFYWTFEKYDEVKAVYDHIIEHFINYEPQDLDEFMKEKRKEIAETKKNKTVQLLIESDDTGLTVRPISSGEKWYDGKHFDELYKYTSEKLGPPKTMISSN